MNTVNFYIYENSGKIVRVGSMSESDISLNVEDGQNYSIGIATVDRHYVENGQLVEMPDKPSENYVFDYTNKTWQPDLKIAESSAIAKRNQLLASGPDRVNPMWWASMTPVEQGEVSSYRQALLDITNQFGYPMDIEWPAIPSVFKG